MQTTKQTAALRSRRFGPEAITSESSDGILIVHTDGPDRETIERQTLAFVADTYFDAGCAMCDRERKRGLVVLPEL